MKITIITSIVVLILSACSQKSEEVKITEAPKKEVILVQEISGVWSSRASGILTFNYRNQLFQFIVGDKPIEVKLGEVDPANETVNLLIPNEISGKEMVWTVRRTWNKEHTSYHLTLTMDDGSREELSFVRKVTADDLNRIANLYSRNLSTGSAKKAIEEASPKVEATLTKGETIVPASSLPVPTASTGDKENALVSPGIAVPSKTVENIGSLSADQAIDLMLKNFNNKIGLLQAKIVLDAIEKPTVGNRKLARERNKDGLAEFSKKEYKAAAELFRTANEADPTDIEAVNNYAFALEMDNQNDLAVATAHEALKLDPARGAPWFSLARALAKKGDQERAAAAFVISNYFSKSKDVNLESLVKLSATSDNENIKRAASRAVEALQNQKS